MECPQECAPVALYLRRTCAHIGRMRSLLTALAALLILAGPAPASERPDFSDRPGVGHPLRFTDASENVFRPRQLVVVTPSGAVSARLPATAPDTRSENRLDLSGTPIIGGLFRNRLAPNDASREGIPLGPITRFGDTLVVDARGTTVSPGSLDVILTANFPRDGAVSYRLGRLTFTPAESPSGNGRDAGAAYQVGSTLVLAGPGWGTAITDWNAFFRDNF